MVSGAFAFRFLYQGESLSLGRALFITYCLIFSEHVLPDAEHWVLQAYNWILPPVGLVAILAAVVRVSYYVLRRDGKSPEWNRAMAKTLHDYVFIIPPSRKP